MNKRASSDRSPASTTPPKAKKQKSNPESSTSIPRRRSQRLSGELLRNLSGEDEQQLPESDRATEEKTAEIAQSTNDSQLSVSASATAPAHPPVTDPAQKAQQMTPSLTLSIQSPIQQEVQPLRWRSIPVDPAFSIWTDEQLVQYLLDNPITKAQETDDAHHDTSADESVVLQAPSGTGSAIPNIPMIVTPPPPNSLPKDPPTLSERISTAHETAKTLCSATLHFDWSQDDNLLDVRYNSLQARLAAAKANAWVLVCDEDLMRVLKREDERLQTDEYMKIQLRTGTQLPVVERAIAHLGMEIKKLDAEAVERRMAKEVTEAEKKADAEGKMETSEEKCAGEGRDEVAMDD